MAFYYFAEPFKVYNNLAIALLTVSIAIFGLMIPYINRLRNNYALEEINLERDKGSLKISEIVSRYNEINEEIGNLQNIKWWIFASIFFYVLVIFFSAWFLNAGSYNCLDFQGCVNNPDKNFQPVWSIPQETKILGVSAKSFIEIVPIGFLIGLIALIWIIFKIYSVTENVAKKELNDVSKLYNGSKKTKTKRKQQKRNN